MTDVLVTEIDPPLGDARVQGKTATHLARVTARRTPAAAGRMTANGVG